MDIHPPEGPTHSLKDFAIHILIVTIGILIALGLEGVREAWREHKAVSEARESFKQELELNQQKLASEISAVADSEAKLNQVIADLPRLSKTPEELTRRVIDIQPGFYFFRTTAWESAIASGVLAHMSEQDLNRFSDAYLGIKNYQDAQKGTISSWLSVKAFYLSHHTFTPADQAAGEEKLELLQLELAILGHLEDEFRGGLRQATGAE